MLRIPELAMNTKCKVKTKCYGIVEEWNSREDAKDYFFDAMMSCEGSERDRYTGIYIQLQNGLNYCTDKEE
jgi:hypothetical protein